MSVRERSSSRLDDAMDGLGTVEEDVQCTGRAFCAAPGHVVTRREGRDGFQVTHVTTPVSAGTEES